jgi:predicted protein tyrosine phosphatase
MIIISSMWKLDDALSQFRAKYVISIIDPGSVPPVLPGIKHASRCNLEFHDVTESTQSATPASSAQIEEIVSFGRSVLSGGDSILIHCTAGVSRSTAAGLVLAASFESVEIDGLVTLLRDKAPYSQPNSLMVRLGDDLLGLGGHLVTAVDLLGDADMEMAPEPFVLNVV